MGLEVLVALKASMSGNLNKLSDSLLNRLDIKDILIDYYKERDLRPELTSAIKSPSLMYEYLSMSLEEKNELDNFRMQFPEYLIGKGGELLGNNRPEKALKSKRTVRFVRKQRYVNLLLKMFDFYFKNRKDEVFGPRYISNDKKLRDKYGKVARALYRNSNTSLKDDRGFSEILKLAIEVNPIIKRYLEKEELTLNYRISQLLDVIDFFLKNRGTKDVFTTNYIENDLEVREKFGKYFGHNLRLYANRFRSMNELIQIAAKQRPEILRYWRYKGK